VSPYIVYLSSLLAGYLAGSISFAVLIARSKGVDIFSTGSGNPGATNILRTLGKPYGYGCFLLDALKGVGAVFIGYGIAANLGGTPQLAGICGLLGSILGHSFSLFLRFRGGKGVATTIGGIFALMPFVMLAGVAVWLAVFFAFRYVSLASLALALTLPVAAWLLHYDPWSTGFCIFLAALIVIRHRSNIQRLIAGTENRSGGRKL
jgi:glycerol-3-phosphate acyltransferase PlsY